VIFIGLLYDFCKKTEKRYIFAQNNQVMSESAVHPSPFSNVQLELLKLFEYNVTNDQLLEIKTLLVRYFAEKIDQEMDLLWVQNQWTEQTIENWANGHDRHKTA
jgi:hypothetical protein